MSVEISLRRLGGHAVGFLIPFATVGMGMAACGIGAVSGNLGPALLVWVMLSLVAALLSAFWNQRMSNHARLQFGTILASMRQEEAPIPQAEGDIGEWTKIRALLLETAAHWRAQNDTTKSSIAHLQQAQRALDALPSAVCLADASDSIVYVNPTLQRILERDEAAFALQIPGFRAADIVGQNLRLFRQSQTEGTPGGVAQEAHADRSRRLLGGRNYEVLNAPVFDHNGNRSGAISQWNDIHDQVLVERELNSVIGAARVGNFRGRIDVAGKDGDHRKMGESVNLLLAASQARLEEVGRVMGALARGDLTQRISMDYQSGAIDITRQFRDQFPEQFALDASQYPLVEGIPTPALRCGLMLLNANYDVVDRFTAITGSVATVFVRDGEDFIRITTSLKDASGKRPVGTKLDRQHAAYAKARNAQSYVGPASLFGKEYMASYEPIRDTADQVVGILFIGFDMSPEQNLFAKLSADVSGTAARLTETITQLREAGESIYTSAREISSGSSDLSNRTERQAASLEETASSMDELTTTVRQSADNARQANELALGAADVARRGGQAVNQVVETMSSIHASSKKVVEIISVIDSIAFQTNILALNAAVEAARAGEQGRGFAVVASEVRSLAQRSGLAAKEIRGLIGDSVDKVTAGSKLADRAGETMQEIVTAVERVTNIMSEIADASSHQSIGIEQVNKAIADMDHVTQQNAALVEQEAAAAESLEEQAMKLAQTMNLFKLEPARGPGQLGLQSVRTLERPAAGPVRAVG